MSSLTYSDPASTVRSVPEALGLDDALALEYQGLYGTTLGQAYVTDFVNEPVFQGVLTVLGLGFEEKRRDVRRGQVGFTQT